MREALESLIQRVVARYSRDHQVPLPEDFCPDMVVTRDPTHGDFASNAAFKLSKSAKKKPIEVAQLLIRYINEENKSMNREVSIEKCQVAGTGFINFYLKKESLGQILLEVREKDWHYGESDLADKKKVLLEFVSANPTGPLTIAHGRQAAIGDCLARILKAAGLDVVKEYYLNNAGKQIDLLARSVYARYLQLQGHEVSVPDEGYHGEYLIQVAEKIRKEHGDQLIKKGEQNALMICQSFALAEMMNQIRDDLLLLGVGFDQYFTESSLYENGSVEKALQFLDQKGCLYKKDGALWFKSKRYGDDKDRVVKKSTGELTYLAPDIAYHRDKFSRGFNWLINLWGPDHHGYVPRLKAACQALGHNQKDVDIRIVQLTTLYRKGQPVRMSTRAGEFVTLRELVDEVGKDASRFFFIMRKVNSHLDFDLDLAKEKSQDNPVYYLQYAHARIASLLKYADRAVPDTANFDLLDSEEERDLVKRIVDYPKYLARAGMALEPYCVADYLRDLATSFHKFYSFHRVVTDEEAVTNARLVLVEAARIVLRNGLDLLGLSQPESM